MPEINAETFVIFQVLTKRHQLRGRIVFIRSAIEPIPELRMNVDVLYLPLLLLVFEQPFFENRLWAPYFILYFAG